MSYQRNRRRRRSRYRLKYPGRLILFILLVVIVIAASVSCGLSKKPSSDEAGGGVETITGSKEVETGTLRSVSTVTLDGVGQQLTTYMASMIYSNPTNYKRTSASPNEETPETETVDLTPYRYVVAVNANVGGANNGWVEGEAIEKNITLAVARQLVDYMNNNSTAYYFLLVRNADNTMTDSARLSRISNYDADLVITLACNGSDLELGGVISTYWEEPTQFDDEGEPIEHSQRDQDSAKLAQDLMEAAADGFGMWYRETEVEDNPLLKLDVPAVKVYMGFLTYELDNDWVQSEEGQVKAAEAMGKVILQYCDEHAPEKTRGQLAGEALAGRSGNNASGGWELFKLSLTLSSAYM